RCRRCRLLPAARALTRPTTRRCLARSATRGEQTAERRDSVETKLLVYATFADAPEHDRARRWLEERLAEGEGTVTLCWPVVYAFLRLITSARVFGRHALTVKDGWTAATAILEQPAVRLVAPGAGHAAIAAALAATPGLRSDDVPDLEIAAL